LLKRIERFVADPNGLQRIVGFIIGSAAIVANAANIIVTIRTLGMLKVDEIFDWYFFSLALITLCGFISAFWMSAFARWLQVLVFLLTAILSGITVRGGDLTSGFFIIFCLVLIFEYRFGRYSYLVGVASALILYPLSLIIGFSKQSSAFLAQSAAVVVIIFCLIILYGSVLLRHEFRHRQDRDLLEIRVKERTIELERALADRSVMLQEIHHRVNNNLQIISSILQLEADREESLILRASREKSLKRVYAMALVHEILYQTEELEKIGLDRYVDRLVDEVRAGSAVDFVLIVDKDILVGLDFAVPFGLLLNELVTNALEHAFPGGSVGRVEIRVESESGDGIGLSVADNGVGIPEDTPFEDARTLGFNLVNALTVQLHGRIDLDRRSGTRWTILFPGREPRSWDANDAFIPPPRGPVEP
jgi:two-component sensor histidine kinase